jgi:outer membrane receptor protein involved in Fe transport
MIAFAGPFGVAADAAQVTASPAPAASAAPQGLSSIAGTVLNSNRNTPIGGAEVLAEGNGHRYSATSKDDGSFEIDLPAGIYDITVSKGGFQTGSVSAFAVTEGTKATVTLSISEANASSLRTIGRVAVTRRNSLNTSSSSVVTLNSDVIQQRDNTNLSDVVPELPGVTLLRTTGATANSFFVVRGGDIETRVNIDGHPLSVGTFGNYNTNYAIGGIFDQVEVVKGAGLSGATAGESAFGTVNIRTRDFSSRNYLEAKGGADSYKGSFYNIFANYNFLPGDRATILLGKAFSGFRGPWDSYIANRIGSFTPSVVGSYQPPTNPGLIQWQGDFSNRYSLEGELAKLRYRFSNTTSVTLEYLGLEGQYIPQGGSYASYLGNVVIAPCYNGSTPAASSAACTNSSIYNAPYASSLASTTTSVPGYQYFPNSYIQNNEPEFSAEFRTALKNDTLVIRPYTALVNRFISGDRENQYPGNNGGWYQVTSANNCQAVFIAPTSGGTGAKGPCFPNNLSMPTYPAYIGAGTSLHGVVFPTTASAPACSASAPCWTTPTAYQNNGSIGFGAPFSQPEIDRLHGVDFRYDHPFGNNLVSLTYAYNADDTYSMTADTTIPYPGCTPTLSGPTNVIPAGKPGAGTPYQPTCPLGQPSLPGSSFLPSTAISIPPTIIRKNDFGLSGIFELTTALRANLGLFYSNYHAAAQTEDPGVLAFYSSTYGSTAAAPIVLAQVSNSVHHFDPHVGFTYRLNGDTSLRATGGSSVTFPYASIISGLGSVSLPNGANNQTYTLSLANTQLAPETTVAYDLGLDFRLPDQGVFSADVYDNTVHNIFAQVTTSIPQPLGAPVATGGYFQSTNINGPIGRYYGLELSLNKQPVVGFGYTLNTSFERAYLDQLPLSIYNVTSTTSVNLINGKQLDGSVNGQGSIPYAKAYGELRFVGLHDFLFSLGADYEGNNNSTYGPAYTVYNGTLRFDVAPNVIFQISGDNIGNLNTGSALGRALLNQGSQTLTLSPLVSNNPAAGLVGGSRTKSLQEVNPRTFRFSLQSRI